jgi:hypothetical protein
MIDMLKLNELSNVGSGCSEEQVGIHEFALVISEDLRTRTLSAYFFFSIKDFDDKSPLESQLVHQSYGNLYRNPS